MDEQKYNLKESVAELDKLLDLSAKETDKTACESLAEKARIIYEQYSESEDTALLYAMLLFNLLVEQVNVEERLNTANAVEQIFELFKHSDSIALRYAMVLVNLSAKQENVEELLNTSNAVKQIFDSFKHSEDIALHYTIALANLSAKQENVEDLLNTANAVEQIFDSFKHSEDIALQYTRTLANLSFEQENVEELLNTANAVKQIFELFKHSESIALRYAMALVDLSTKQGNVEERLNTANKIEQAFELFKHSEDIALHYAMALVNLSAKQENVEDRLNAAKTIKQIFEFFKHSEAIALRYTMALVNLSAKQGNVEELLNTVKEIEQIFELFEHSERIALHYTMALVNLSFEQENVEELLNTANEIRQIFKLFKHSEDIALHYTMVLFNLAVKQENVEELLNTANEIRQIFELFKHSEDIALHYAMALVNLSAKQENVEERLNTANKVEQIFKLFKHSEDIALRYTMVLFNSSVDQEEGEELLNTINKIEQIFELFKYSEDIALRYAKTLVNLSNLQDDIEDIVNKILDILKNVSSVEIFNILVDMLQNNPAIKLDTDKIPTTSLTKILDKLCLNSNIDTDRELLIRALNLKLGSDRKLVLNTKYDILNGWIEYYKEVKDKDKLNQLIDIYRIVQEIKFKLGLKEDNKELQFGHYTKGSTLQVMLDQEENEKKKNTFSVSGKTRLYNANYMNDPEEGIVIEKILGLDRRDILEPSSWFLMSFTSKTDDLAMWSQYGDDAKGVCLVLREDDFSRFTSFNDVSWRKEAIPIVETVNTIESTLSYDLKSSPNELNNIKPTIAIKDEEKRSKSEKKENVPKGNSDYLYRIAYVKNIDKDKDIDEDIELEQTELFSKSEIEDLAKMLNSLKKKLDSGSKVKEENYQNAISECIEEIRYLFKSVDYKYENELRILRYANLDPSNKEIKIDYSPEFGKLYLEREENIQIGEVIFGPKFPNPEYVTPLLKLLDNDIKYEKSTIKFR